MIGWLCLDVNHYCMPDSAPVPSPEPASPAGVQAVGVAFAVLSELASTPQAVGTSELARRLGETKARVHRHLATLRALGYVDKDSQSDRYRLGWRAYRFAVSVFDNFGLRQLAHRHLMTLHHQSGQTAALGLPADGDVAVVDAIQSTSDIAITIRAGSVIPAVSSALGRVLLAFMPESERGTWLARPISALTPHTLQDASEVEAILLQVQKNWYCLAANERLPGIAALAAPVFDDRNRVVAAVSVIGSSSDISPQAPAALIHQVQTAAMSISAELHSRAWLQLRS